MSSSAPRSVERRRPATAAVAGLVLLAALAAPASTAAESALDTCAAEGAADRGRCLEDLAAAVAADLAWVQARAEAYFAGLDALTGNDRASRTLRQAEAAYALFRELDCHLVEIDQGIGPAAALHGLACRIDHDSTRLASLVAMIGDADAPERDAGPENAATEPLIGTWQVVEIDGEPIAAEIDITLEVAEDGSISGRGGCNRYFGGAEIMADGGLRFGEIGATRMACPDPMMEHETRYFAALARVAAFTRANDALELADVDDNVIIRLTLGAD